MLTKIYWFTFVLVSIFFVINPQSPVASTTTDVKYDGKRLSVQASGIPLEQLLSMVEKQTGIHFSYDDLLAETNVYANFENNSLADGVRRMLLQFNYAAIYDESGHIKTVWIVNRKRGSSESRGDQIDLYESQQQTVINDIMDVSETIPDQEDAPPDYIAVTLADQEGAPPFSEQVSGQEASGHDIPPGANESVTTPPPGEEPLKPVVDPNASPPPGEEALAPVVDTSVTPPAGQKPLEPVFSLEMSAESPPIPN